MESVTRFAVHDMSFVVLVIDLYYYCRQFSDFQRPGWVYDDFRREYSIRFRTSSVISVLFTNQFRSFSFFLTRNSRTLRTGSRTDKKNFLSSLPKRLLPNVIRNIVTVTRLESKLWTMFRVHWEALGWNEQLLQVTCK